MQPNHNFGGSEILLEVSLKLDTRPQQYCHIFKILSMYDQFMFCTCLTLYQEDILDTGNCNLHALSSEKEKNQNCFFAKHFCRRHAGPIPARSTQEEKPDQLDQEKVHR